MKIAICQINTTVGDFKGNLLRIKNSLSKASVKDCDLAVFPELSLCGYPPKDFCSDRNFLKANEKALEDLESLSKSFSCAILVGHIGQNGKPVGKPIFNSASVIKNGKIIFTQHKSLLPTYDVFDEGRYFEPAKKISVFEFQGKKLGISICEDIWNDENFWKTRMYHNDPIEKLAEEGAEVLINLSSSPYYIGKRDIKERMLSNVAKKHSLPLVYVNLVGGNDDLIFEGRSLAFGRNGELIARLKPFKEDVQILDVENLKVQKITKSLAEPAEIYEALALGTKDYVKKCGFGDVVIGLSGGIDSALVACIAVKALGNKHVLTVNMPSKYSSQSSIKDSAKLSKNLKVKHLNIPIHETFNAFEKVFKKIFAGKKPDTTEENIQARIRANILMSISNKEKKLVLSCGNKSELAVGYCTLYGDLSGGLAVISDLPKTKVYELAKYINQKAEVIPDNILIKPPSAELKPDQKDEDTLPPYEILDEVLKLYIEETRELKDISKKVEDKNLTRSILNSVLLNEYKRNQAPPGLKITTKAFGYGRRFPIAHRFRF